MENLNIYIPFILLFVSAVVKYGRAQIMNRFLYTDTISPQSAKRFKDVGVTDLLLVKFLIYRGILKNASGDLYYLDLDRKYQIEKGYERYLTGLVIVAVLFLIGASVVVLLR